MSVHSDRALTPGAFEKLLGTLAADRDTAGSRYETLRAGLIRFFEWRGCGEAERLADETIDRVCRKIEAGQLIDGSGAYFHAVARNVLREHFKSQRRRDRLWRLIPPPADGSAWEHPLLAGSESERLACLDRSLQELPEDERELLQQYYEADGAGRIAGHQHLAQRLGISAGNLRIRVHRLRQALKAGIERCLETRGDRRRRFERGWRDG